MALRNAFCPNCGQATKIDDEKEFCFCLSCGNKIQIPRKGQPRTKFYENVIEYEPAQGIREGVNKGQHNQGISVEPQSASEDKMKEAEFYYNLSCEKREYDNLEGEPTYYLKGQDLLVELSQQFPADYRVWWELCKPMDFTIVLSGEKSNNPCTINNIYFDKALNLAPLDRKMELVRQHDKYLSVKNVILERISADQRAKEEEERVRNEELQRKEKEAEKERERQEQIRRQEELERQQRVRIEAEQKVRDLWSALSTKNYSDIDNSYFQFNSPEGIVIVATLKVVANVLYLSAYHIDEKKNNQIYLDQSLAIHFGNDGVALKFDSKPVIVRGWKFTNSNMKIFINLDGKYMINDIVLYRDPVFVANISKRAKKPLVALKKIFN